jgi:hypothetical protein
MKVVIRRKKRNQVTLNNRNEQKLKFLFVNKNLL